MIPMITYLKPDGTTYISSVQMDCCDLQVPENPYGEFGIFDRPSHTWVKDTEKIAAIELESSKKEVSSTILAGFNYDVNGVTYRIRYNTFDQINFQDMINSINLDPEAYSEIAWYGYTDTGTRTILSFTKDEFIELYKTAVRFKTDLLTPTE